MRTKRQNDVVFEPVMRSLSMRRIDQILQTVAPKDVTVTLIGESGTGKEILARRTHELSKRRAGPFIPINCAAIPDALFESELFGHEKGAFTGASERSIGKVEAAEGGTLFLDEIGELPLLLQAKLLRFLESRRYMRVGGAKKMQADVRLVFATLRPLEQEVREGRFRADLYYRIQGVTLNVPSLRERRADIAPLIAQFAAQLSSRHGVERPRLTRQARAAMLQYDWPGNVRELRNVVETLCLLRGGREARLADLPDPVRGATKSSRASVGPEALTLSLDRPLDELVGAIVQAVLDAEGGNRTQAAARLGVSVRTLQRYVASGRVADLPSKR
ncbi:MAG: sigma-54-dependent Fis family transcriptional regulator [Deltaproteobacteria bacterium]|nr:sigma-54-dependent Fis family transcriptional regulator [Deltaproteobacteria bacterium]